MRDKCAIGIGGPCGCGKSTFTAVVASRFNVTPIYESVPLKLLDTIEHEGKNSSYALQEAIIKRKIQSINNLNDSRNIIVERTIEEDREVFFNLHHSLGFLDAGELRALRLFSKVAEKSTRKPDVLIFLTASYDTLLGRLLRDNEHIRPKWLVESLEKQLEYYDKWSTFNDPRCIKIDTTSISLDQLVNVATNTIKGLNLS